jgi:phosphosulfolactate synthase
MTSVELDLPARAGKPRQSGITMMIDNGLPSSYFRDVVSSGAEYIDIVKFGWGTALVTADLSSKIECLHQHDVRFCFGGTLFEKFVVQDRFESFLQLCRQWRCDLVEVSNGTIPLSNSEKASYIRKCADSFVVVSEMGFKDATRSETLSPDAWVDGIDEDLDAGATMVIAEARESGRSGICRPDGQLRQPVVDAIVAAGFGVDRLLFEAPTKDLQARFVTMFGSNVNLGNIAAADVLGLETLRLGLRSDTLLSVEAASGRA